MFEIEFYEDENGTSPVYEFVLGPDNKTTKELSAEGGALT